MKMTEWRVTGSNTMLTVSFFKLKKKDIMSMSVLFPIQSPAPHSQKINLCCGQILLW